jgi:hypothetical protein
LIKLGLIILFIENISLKISSNMKNNKNLIKSSGVLFLEEKER